MHMHVCIHWIFTSTTPCFSRVRVCGNSQFTLQIYTGIHIHKHHTLTQTLYVYIFLYRRFLAGGLLR